MKACDINFSTEPRLFGTLLPGWSNGLKVIGFLSTMACLIWIAKAWQDNFTQAHRLEASTQARLLLSLEDTNTGLMEVRGLNSHIYFASPAACRILGYAPMELNGKDMRVILPDGFRSIHEHKVKEAMGDVIKSHNTRVSTMQCRALGKDGNQREVVIRIFVSSNGIFALINRYEDMKYMVMPVPPES